MTRTWVNSRPHFECRCAYGLQMVIERLYTVYTVVTAAEGCFSLIRTYSETVSCNGLTLNREVGQRNNLTLKLQQAASCNCTVDIPIWMNNTNSNDTVWNKHKIDIMFVWLWEKSLSVYSENAMFTRWNLNCWFSEGFAHYRCIKFMFRA